MEYLNDNVKITFNGEKNNTKEELDGVSKSEIIIFFIERDSFI